MTCNWTDDRALRDDLSDLDSEGAVLVMAAPDVNVVLNDTCETLDAAPSLVYQMEPHMPPSRRVRDPIWRTHAQRPNLFEPHVSMDVVRHGLESFKTVAGRVSVIMSAKCSDPGQRMRRRFVAGTHIPWDLYGRPCGDARYMGPLPHKRKDLGLVRYKYTFAAENNSLHNYVTEKLVDAILCECLCFYWGAPNVADIIDERAYVRIDISDLNAQDKVLECIANGEWERRREHILCAKQRLLKSHILATIASEAYRVLVDEFIVQSCQRDAPAPP